MKRFSLLIMMCLLARFGAGAQVVILSGTITDQDGKPVQNAVVTFYNNSVSYQASTDALGRYQVLIDDGGSQFRASVSASGHAPITRSNLITPSEQDHYDFVIHNAVDFKKDVQSTIILPIDPDPSAGRYFYLSGVEQQTIIFEPEPRPWANVPYLFFPNKDMRIDISNLDLTLPAGNSTFNYSNNRYLACLGSYSDQWDNDMPESKSCMYLDEGGRHNLSHSYDLNPMHFTLIFDNNYFGVSKLEIPEIYIMGLYPFIDEKKVWKVAQMLAFTNIVDRYQYNYFDGDTIIDGRQCKKMYRADTPFSNEQQFYMGAWYEEGGKIFYATPNSDQLILFYDFNLFPNRSIQMQTIYHDYILNGYLIDRFYCKEESYKGICVAIAPLRTMWDDVAQMEIEDYDSLHPFYWREGVGGYRVDDNAPEDAMVGGNIRTAACYIGDEVLFYDPELIITDSEVKKNWLDFTHTVKTKPKAPRRGEATTSDEELVTGEYSIKELFVNFKTLTGSYTISITDAAGQPIYNKVVQTSNVVALNTDISTYPKGSYTITVENEEEAYSAEFTISDEDGLSPQPPLFQRGGEAGAVYDLSGRRIADSSLVTRHSSLSKGIYILDGRKVVVR